MARSTRDGMVSGLVLGFAVAFGFALVIRFIPAAWFVDAFARALLFAAQVPGGIVFVPAAVAVARARGESPRQVLLWACCGALAFDGLVIGFWPALYGQEGAALMAVATLLLWAFAWILAAALLFAPADTGNATTPDKTGLQTAS
jgi:hypothetical protein